MNIFYIIAIILMVLGSFGVAPRAINLWYLGWAFVICGLVFGGAVVRL